MSNKDKLCKECKFCIKDKYTLVCAKTTNIVTAGPADICRTHREHGPILIFFAALLIRWDLCGRNGRWFEQKKETK